MPSPEFHDVAAAGLIIGPLLCAAVGIYLLVNRDRRGLGPAGLMFLTAAFLFVVGQGIARDHPWPAVVVSYGAAALAAAAMLLVALSVIRSRTDKENRSV